MHLKLPNHDVTVQRQLLRQMSVVAQHPGEMMAADDYLQPLMTNSYREPDSPGWEEESKVSII